MGAGRFGLEICYDPLRRCRSLDARVHPPPGNFAAITLNLCEEHVGCSVRRVVKAPADAGQEGARGGLQPYAHQTGRARCRQPLP